MHSSFALRNFNLERAAVLLLFKHDYFSQAEQYLWHFLLQVAVFQGQ